MKNLLQLSGKVFITGTDTGCGKTMITTTLLAALQKEQKTVVAIKPVATGFVADSRDNEDELILKSMQPELTLPVCCRKFALPVAPNIAARAENTAILFEELVEFCHQHYIQSRPEVMLIEGAGGLLVPLTDTSTWIDFIHMLGARVLLVVGIRLGAINHALLTAAMLRAAGISCVGWIANCLCPETLQMQEVIDTIREFMERDYKIPLFTIVDGK